MSSSAIRRFVEHCDAHGLELDDRNFTLRYTSTIPRCVGSKHEVVDFKVFCAVALAGLGQLPETIMSRSIIVKMRRRAPGEFIEGFRSRKEAPIGN